MNCFEHKGLKQGTWQRASRGPSRQASARGKHGSQAGGGLKASMGASWGDKQWGHAVSGVQTEFAVDRLTGGYWAWTLEPSYAHV